MNIQAVTGDNVPIQILTGYNVFIAMTIQVLISDNVPIQVVSGDKVYPSSYPSTDWLNVPI